MIKRETEKNRKINTEEYKLLEIEQTIMPFLEKKIDVRSRLLHIIHT